MEIPKCKDVYLLLLKWLPVAGTLLVAVHYLLLMFGIRSILLDFVTDTSLFAWLYLYFSSRLFFCRLHRHFVFYIGIASLDINLHHWTGWRIHPDWLMPSIMISLATILVTYAVITKFNCDE